MFTIQNCLIVISALILFVLYLKKKFELFLIISSLGLVIMPPFYVTHVTKIPFHYFYSFIVIALSLIRMDLQIIKKDKIYYLLFSTVLYLFSFFNTFLFINKYDAFPYLSIISFFLQLIVYNFLLNTLHKAPRKMVESIIFIYVLLLNLINATTSLIQFFGGGVEVFFNLYYSSTINPLLSVVKTGFFTRGFGLFPSPVYYGFNILMSFALLKSTEETIDKRKYYFALLLIIINVILSLSKLAILGFSLSYLFGIFIYLKKQRTRIRIKETFAFILLIACFFILLPKVIDILEENRFPASYYFNIDRIIEQSMDRYTQESRIFVFSETYSAIINNPLGSGYGRLFNEFLGDSDYITILKISGLHGLALYLVFLLYNSITILKTKSHYLLLIIIGFFFSGFALSVANSHGSLFYWAVLSTLLEYATKSRA